MIAESPTEPPRSRLLLAPVAFPDESAASWVQRVTGAHQYSLKRFSLITGLRPAREDWDCLRSNAEWRHLVQLSDAAEDTCGLARYGLKTLRERLPKERHLRYYNGSPSYGWCADCLIDDETPYLRWEWRIKEVKRCKIHGCRLDLECGWCSSPLTVQRALLVACAGHPGVLGLDICAKCGMSLVDAGSVVYDATDRDLDNPMHEVITHLHRSYANDPHQLDLAFDEYAKWRGLTAQDILAGAHDAVTWTDLSIHRKSHPQRCPLRLSGDNFKRTDPGPIRADAPERWSDDLRSSDRRTLAHALRVIRHERRQLRRDIKDAGTTGGGEDAA